MIDKLEEALNSSAVEEKVEERNQFARVYITRPALEKAQIYARLARDYDGDYIECYGYLLGNPDRKHRIVDDIYFAPNQSAGSAHVTIPARAVSAAGKEINARGKRILGWWHSHANFEPFHSGTDQDNFTTVLNQIAPSNYLMTYEALEFLGDDIKKTRDGDSTIFICDRNNTSRRLEMIFKELDENPLAGMPLDKLIVRLPVQTSYAYSIVVNAKGSKPFVALATRRFCSSCQRDEDDVIEKIPLRIVNYDSGIELDQNKLYEEVKSKMRIYVPPARNKISVPRNFDYNERVRPVVKVDGKVATSGKSFSVLRWLMGRGAFIDEGEDGSK